MALREQLLILHQSTYDVQMVTSLGSQTFFKEGKFSRKRLKAVGAIGKRFRVAISSRPFASGKIVLISIKDDMYVLDLCLRRGGPMESVRLVS